MPSERLAGMATSSLVSRAMPRMLRVWAGRPLRERPVVVKAVLTAGNMLPEEAGVFLYLAAADDLRLSVVLRVAYVHARPSRPVSRVVFISSSPGRGVGKTQTLARGRCQPWRLASWSSSVTQSGLIVSGPQ